MRQITTGVNWHEVEWMEMVSNRLSIILYFKSGKMLRVPYLETEKCQLDFDYYLEAMREQYGIEARMPRK